MYQRLISDVQKDHSLFSIRPKTNKGNICRRKKLCSSQATLKVEKLLKKIYCLKFLLKHTKEYFLYIFFQNFQAIFHSESLMPRQLNVGVGLYLLSTLELTLLNLCQFIHQFIHRAQRIQRSSGSSVRLIFIPQIDSIKTITLLIRKVGQLICAYAV